MKKVLCKQCGIKFLKQLHRIGENNFCSRSCSATFNNRKSPKRKKAENNCSRCGKLVDRRSKTCRKCWSALLMEKNDKLTISEALVNTANTQSLYSRIRSLARRKMALLDIPHECGECIAMGIAFDLTMDVCHIRPLKDFPMDALVGEANAEENMIYLCPSHHRLQEKA